MSLTVKTIRIANRHDDHGALIFAGEFLVAVLSRLTSQHEESEGRWYTECSFGAAADGPEEFPDLDTACAWIETRMSGDHPAST